jgi:hypothetical protein
MAKRSKRHHYLPQFYLQGFAGKDGLLSLYDRETKTFRKQQPLNTALEKDFYTITDKQGLKSDGIEQMLSDLETVAKCVISRLDTQQTGWENEQERVSFAIFIAFFHCRTPAFDKEQTALVEHLYRVWMKSNHPTEAVTAQWFAEFAKESGEEVDRETIEEFYKMAQNDQYDVEVPRQYIVKLMGDAAMHLAEVLLTLNWTFVSAPPNLAFITSDAPFTIAPPPDLENDWRAYGVLTPGAASSIPLSPRTCLIIAGEGGKDCYGHIRKDAARHINENVAKNSDRFIIARDQPYLERLVKRARVDQHRWTSRFEFKTENIDGDLLFHVKRARPRVE